MEAIKGTPVLGLLFVGGAAADAIVIFLSTASLNSLEARVQGATVVSNDKSTVRQKNVHQD